MIFHNLGDLPLTQSLCLLTCVSRLIFMENRRNNPGQYRLNLLLIWHSLYKSYNIWMFAVCMATLMYKGTLPVQKFGRCNEIDVDVFNFLFFSHFPVSETISYKTYTRTPITWFCFGFKMRQRFFNFRVFDLFLNKFSFNFFKLHALNKILSEMSTWTDKCSKMHFV